ncbi:MAG TPA: DUF362 domain-containing protein [Oscillatoriaceae cyanobacterium]
MSSEVFFAQRRATQGGGLLDKLEQLCDAAGFSRLAGAGELVAVKIAFGEPGNTTILRPQYAQRVVRKLLQYGGRPFLTDTLPLPPSKRATAVDALVAAARHGYDGLEAPLVPADGLLGHDAVRATGAEPLAEVELAAAIAQADTLVGLNHFTGHEASGFAGALWNLGFGAAALATKRAILGDEPGKGHAALQARLVEAAAAIAQQKSQRWGFVNLLVDLTPETDDQGYSDAAVVPDIGVLASRDPVALDQASVDLFNQTAGIPGTRLGDPLSRDKLHELYPHVDWEIQLRVAEARGVGSRDYELMII